MLLWSLLLLLLLLLPVTVVDYGDCVGLTTILYLNWKNNQLSDKRAENTLRQILRKDVVAKHKPNSLSGNEVNTIYIYVYIYRNRVFNPSFAAAVVYDV